MQSELKNILLMPITIIPFKPDKYNVKINMREGTILSTQKYKGNDPDMSDIAIKFYEIIYEFKPGEKSSPYKNFAGDTMNSYNTVARFASIPQKEFWHKHYHCLANFWVLPNKIGRGFGKLSKASGGRQVDSVDSFNKGKRDYMDRFLYLYKESYHVYLEDYPEYTTMFPLDDSFPVKHYLTDIYMKNGDIIDFSYIKQDGDKKFADLVDEVIKTMWKKTEERAKLISDSDKAEELWNYFSKCI